MISTPVALIAFCRPDLTRRNVAVLREVQPSQLLVIADGPRPGHTEDERNCAAVRAVIDEIDWPCTVQRCYAESNIGVEANVELGLDWVFSRVDRAIVLEDDCIPDPTFFSFCEELLDRYANDPRVWHIAGESHGVPARMFGDRSYDFSTWASVWGWATWADRWHAHRAEFDRDHAGAVERVDKVPRTAPAHRRTPVSIPREALVTEAAHRHFAAVAATTDGDQRGWDNHWWVTIMSRAGLSVMPSVKLVQNDGYGEGATHTRAEKAPEPAESMTQPLVHPPAVALNHEIEREMELLVVRRDGRLSRLARRLIRPLWLRSLVRRTIEFPPVWWVVRRVVGR